MKESPNARWVPLAMLFGVAYPVIGVTFALPANSAASNVRFTWRLAAWLACAALFAAHIWCERSRPAFRAAIHVAVAVGIGAFLLAVWVNVHALWSMSSYTSSRSLWALVLFPAVTAVPAFVVALLASSILALSARRGSP